MEKLTPRFENVSCSQCGGAFGPGEHGFSHCENHQGMPRTDYYGLVRPCGQTSIVNGERILCQTLRRGSVRICPDCNPRSLDCSMPTSEQPREVLVQRIEALQDIIDRERAAQHSLFDEQLELTKFREWANERTSMGYTANFLIDAWDGWRARARLDAQSGTSSKS